MPDTETAPATAANGSALTNSASLAGKDASSGIPAAEPVAEAAAPSKFDVLVDLWFAECIQNTPVGRYTDAYNAIYAAKDELKRRLNQET